MVPISHSLYTFLSFPGFPAFTILSSNGEVTVASTIDYETEVRHLVLVRATDQGSPALSGEAYLSIAVVPVNEFDPAITAVADQTVSETATPGERLVM